MFEVTSRRSRYGILIHAKRRCFRPERLAGKADESSSIRIALDDVPSE
jgi:hypothetical protein